MFKFLVLLFLGLLFFQPEKGVYGTKEGLLLWYNAVLPAQLPFIMGVRIFMKTIPFNKISPVLFNFAVGMLAGYPVGSMTTAELYKKGYIEKNNVTLLAAFSNMAGPLFVLGTVGDVLFGNVRRGYVLLIVHWITAVMLSIRPIMAERKIRLQREKNALELKKESLVEKGFKSIKTQTLGSMLGDAVEETARLMLKIAGFIVLFSVLKQWIGGALGALLEMSGGVQWIIGQNVDIQWKLAGCSFLINFSGICVILQSLGSMGECPISIFKFVRWKIFQGILAAGITLVICQFLIL